MTFGFDLRLSEFGISPSAFTSPVGQPRQPDSPANPIRPLGAGFFAHPLLKATTEHRPRARRDWPDDLTEVALPKTNANGLTQRSRPHYNYATSGAGSSPPDAKKAGARVGGSIS